MDRALWAFCAELLGCQCRHFSTTGSNDKMPGGAGSHFVWPKPAVPGLPPIRHATARRHIGELAGREAARTRVFTRQRRVTRLGQNVVARPLILSRIPPANQMKFPRTLHHVCSS